MIFVTVGTQLGFPRLLHWMDAIAGRNSLEVFAQTAEPDAHYGHIEHRPFVTPTEYDALLGRCRILVGHAGIGTIMTAKQRQLPLIIVPRAVSFNEHRNDHQEATVRNLSDHKGIYVARNESELEQCLLRPALAGAAMQATPAKSALQSFLKGAIYG